MTRTRLAVFSLLGCIALGTGCVIGLVVWRGVQLAEPAQSAVPVSVFSSLPAKLLVGGFVLSILGGVASVAMWLFAAAPLHPDAEPASAKKPLF